MSIAKTVIGLGGLAAAVGFMSSGRRRIVELRRSLDRLEASFAGQANSLEARFQRIESRLDEHEKRLNEIPSTSEMLAAVDDLLSNAMRRLDGRLTVQERSIEALKATVGRTDHLLEQVLECVTLLRGDVPPLRAASAGAPPRATPAAH